MRLTKIRSAMISIIDKYPKPLATSNILDLLKKQNINANKTTIYRELEFLKSEDVIREVIFKDGILRFEKNSGDCHHHTVCNNCGKINDIKIEESNLFKSIESQSNFLIQSHSIEFFGLCHNCKG